MMLTVNRFDANAPVASSSGSASTSGTGAPPTSSRLAALAERKRKRPADEPVPRRSSSSSSSQGAKSNGNAQQGIDPSGSTSSYTAPPAAPGVPSIHPSRLATAPLLARSVKKAAAAAGVQKEKTKAKQRYLKKKNQRRKAKLKATAATQPKANAVSKRPDSQAKAGEDDTDNDTSSSDSSSSSSSDDEDEAKPKSTPLAPAVTTQKQAVPEGHAAAVSSSSSSSSSDSDSDSESASASDSDSSSSSDSSSDSDSEDTSDAPLSSTIEGDTQDGTQSAQTDFLKPFARAKRPGVESAEAIQALAAQGLPRGMAYPQVVKADTRIAVDATAPGVEGITNTTTEEEADEEGAAPPLTVALDSAMTKRLKEIGIVEWFAVQTAVIPHLMSTPSRPSPFAPPRDLCVSAPTGSGKTLAYSIPLISHLKSRIVIRLRALIILPTRDLVSQVRETLEVLAKGSGLRIGSVTGAQSFAQEQSLLVDAATGESKLDILISTPGRLIDHLDESKGFTLQHLRFLVIDEADRLLGQSFHNWAQRLRSSLEGPSAGEVSSALSTARQLAALPPRSTAAYDPARAEPVVQKLLFSATLTREPGKLAELGLRDPVFIDVRDEAAAEAAAKQDGSVVPSSTAPLGHFSLPATLQEHMLVVPTASKPLQLIHLLLSPPSTTSEPNTAPMERTLVFTKSVDSALRLVRLLDLFFKEAPASILGSHGRRLTVADYSSDLSPGQRRETLKAFKDGKVDVLVASDLISRGIDLPFVENVVSYDVPIDASKYVHRVGRTARANRTGKSWSLVEEQEARFFKKMLREQLGRLDKVKKIKVKEADVSALEGAYQRALQQVVASFASGGGRS